MSFFMRKNVDQPLPGTKRKYIREKSKETKKKWKKEKNGDITSESDEEGNNNEQIYSDDDDDDAKLTAQEKKLKLTKIYLEEIKRQELERQELKEENGISQSVQERLKNDFLESKGRLRKSIADKCVTDFDPHDFRVFKPKDKRDVITKVVVTSKNDVIFSGSKKGEVVKYRLTDGTRQKTLLLKCVDKSGKLNYSPIQDISVSYDDKFLAIAQSNEVKIFDVDLNQLKVFKDHKDTVTGVAFRYNSHRMYTCSKDRTVRVYSLDEMTFVETLFGHQNPITSIDAWTRERAVTSGGSDGTVRVWKIPEDSQLIFNGPFGCSLDHVQFVTDDYFLTGGTDGAISIWSCMKKKPCCTVAKAHGVDSSGEANWITCVAAFKNTDLAASGSSNGYVKLWKFTDSYKTIELLAEIPVEGFVNSLAFAPNGEHLIVAVGKEHRMGRWVVNQNAINSIVVIPLKSDRVNDEK